MGALPLENAILYSIIFGLFNITFTMYRDVPKVSGHCNFLLYIFYIKPQFLKTLFQSQFLFDFDEIFTNRTSEARTYVIFCDYF